MLPSGEITEQALQTLAKLLAKGDVLVMAAMPITRIRAGAPIGSPNAASASSMPAYPAAYGGWTRVTR